MQLKYDKLVANLMSNILKHNLVLIFTNFFYELTSLSHTSAGCREEKMSPQLCHSVDHS